MPYSIRTSRFAFVQFDESQNVESCQYGPEQMCLPVYAPDDVWFPFIIIADTEEEADALCDLAGESVRVGLAENCEDAMTVMPFQPTRFRISERQVLYHWPHGLTLLNNYAVGKCFYVKVEVPDNEFCSTTCFQRIGDPCHTSVIEYSNDENAFDFFYCASGGDDEALDTETCDPTIISFSNQSSIVIPWTAFLSNKYGDAPSVEVWEFIDGDLQKVAVDIRLDTYPPTELRIDFGGTNSGIIKIM